MDDLKELLGKVTPGPWDVDPHGVGDCMGDVWLGEDVRVCENATADDARLIAMAPDLAAEVLRLRAEVERLTEALQNALAAGLPDVVAEAARAALPGNSAGTGCKLSCECPDCNEM